jgi:5-methylthioadenosine/S-adenosylhomocysteine deaminase
MCAALPRASVPDGNSQGPQAVDWVLTNAWVIPCDHLLSTIPQGAVAIDDGNIVAVGAAKDIGRRFQGRREMDLTDHLLLPGLINAHTHAAMTFFRGLGDDLPLNQWLHDVIFPTEARWVRPELVYWGTLLAAVEMLANGITTVCDGYFFEESAARAALDSGIRAVLGQGVLDFPTPDQPDPMRMRDRVAEFLESFPASNGRLRPSLFCHAPYTCRPETLQWVKELCRQRGLLFQTHLSETAGEVKEIQERYGDRPVFFLERLGILDAATLCAHGVWLERTEIECLAKHQVGLAHTAESNMKLASGIAPVPAMLAAGIKIGLGTDGCASNNNLDVFAEMDMVAKLHKVFDKDPVVCSARQVLHMGTLQGARALCWDDAIGSLEVGKQADIIAIDVRRPHLTPLYDPISHLVYAISGSDVRHVWVGGRQILGDGRILTVNVADVMAEVRELAGRMGER